MSFKGHDISWLIAAISTTICVKNHVIFYSCCSGTYTVYYVVPTFFKYRVIQDLSTCYPRWEYVFYTIIIFYCSSCVSQEIFNL